MAKETAKAKKARLAMEQEDQDAADEQAGVVSPSDSYHTVSDDSGEEAEADGSEETETADEAPLPTPPTSQAAGPSGEQDRIRTAAALAKTMSQQTRAAAAEAEAERLAAGNGGQQEEEDPNEDRSGNGVNGASTGGKGTGKNHRGPSLPTERLGKEGRQYEDEEVEGGLLIKDADTGRP